MKTEARIVEGDPGRVICQEAKRLQPAAVIIGTRGRSLMQRSFVIIIIFFHIVIWLLFLSLYQLFYWIIMQCVTGKCGGVLLP